MAFDFKKEFKEFYMPKNKPEIVNVPKANYIAVRGKGNPNEEGGAYQHAISILLTVWVISRRNIISLYSSFDSNPITFAISASFVLPL